MKNISFKDTLLGFRASLVALSQSEKWLEVKQRANNENTWFTDFSMNQSLEGLVAMLSDDRLDDFEEKYKATTSLNGKKVGVITAGNIPAVGFHDALCVLLSGAELFIKLSSSDKAFMLLLLDLLEEQREDWRGKIHVVEQLSVKELNGVIATGSDNTARYFEKYFAAVPHIIRKNRSSVAILNGKESKEDFVALGKDVFSYFGLGCRNVSKLLIPQTMDLVPLLDAFEEYGDVFLNHRYKNNYDYNKSILLVNGVDHLDTGFLLLRKSEELVSPISVLFFQRYDSSEDVKEFLHNHEEKVQCVTSASAEYGIGLGGAQSPSLLDYPDNVDVMNFLFNELN